MKKKIFKRKIEFNGFHKHDSLVIGNHGNVEFIAKGSFDLSGLIFCKHSVEFKIVGDGAITFNGLCNSLILNVKGNCILDFSKVNCKEIFCESIKGKSIILLGPTKAIRIDNLEEGATLKYTGTPLIVSYSLKGDAIFESPQINKRRSELLNIYERNTPKNLVGKGVSPETVSVL